ncbi:MAG: transcriptional regulator [Pirellulales bacterium]|nr:transcriptional regulator [Pirellulales bacterium]
MAAESPLVRQWRLLRTLSARRYGVTVKEMAEESGTSQKTIRRDLDMLSNAGFPLIEQKGAHGRKTWRLGPSADRPELSFTFDEAIALYLAQHLLEPLAGTPFWHAAQGAFKKIRASFGTEVLKYAERFGGMFHHTTVGASDYSRKAELIDRLMIGIEDRHAVFITYQSLRSTEPITYDIWPLGLPYHHGSLYLVGHSCQHDEIRHWKIDRLEDVELTSFPFQPPKDFDLKQHLARSFGIFHGDGDVHVVVRFSPEVARYVGESRWHESQRLTEQGDGSLLAEFDLSNTEEIKRWLLGFGRHAEVIEPEELRGEIVEEFVAAMSVYGVTKHLNQEAVQDNAK